MTLTAHTVLLDTVNTLYPNTLIAGGYTDARLGRVDAGFYSQLACGGVDLNFKTGTTTTIDSAFIEFTYVYYYGDTTQPITLEVYRVTDLLDTSANDYTSKSAPAVDPTAIGTLTFTPQPNKDGIVKIPLTTTMAQELIDQSGTANISNTDNFIQYFRGIYVKAAGTPSCVLGFTNFNSSDLDGIRLYFNIDGTASTHTFFLSSSLVQFNQVTSNRSGSEVATLVNTRDSLNENLSNNLLYMQCGAGLRIKIDIPYLQLLKSQLGDIAINKAELVMTSLSSEPEIMATPAYVEVQPAAPGLNIRTNSNGNALYINTPSAILFEDQSTTQRMITYQDTDTREYRLEITRYFQEIYNGTTPNYGLLILPGAYGLSVNRAVIAGQGHSENPLTLRIFYTKLQ